MRKFPAPQVQWTPTPDTRTEYQSSAELLLRVLRLTVYALVPSTTIKIASPTIGFEVARQVGIDQGGSRSHLLFRVEA